MRNIKENRLSLDTNNLLCCFEKKITPGFKSDKTLLFSIYVTIGQPGKFLRPLRSFHILKILSVLSVKFSTGGRKTKNGGGGGAHIHIVVLRIILMYFEINCCQGM